MFAKKFILVLLSYVMLSASSYGGELYQKFGVFDIKHKNETDAYAMTTKYIQDKEVNLGIIDELKPIYELSFYYDDHNKNNQGYGAYVSSGLSKKINLTNSLFLLPSFSAGLYQEFDEGKDMGYPLEFKSEVELNFKILNSSIIGVSYSHISNADIGDKNPGSDNLLFNFRLSENF